MNNEELIEILQSNFDGDVPIEVNNEHWTLADLFARQWLNNLSDGFNMVNVKQMYNLLCKHKQLLINNNMINEVAWNNSGYPLWDEYNFDLYYKGDEEE